MNLTQTQKYLLATAGVLLLFGETLFGRSLASGLSYLGRSDLPRGMRNNNPGNLKISGSQWAGKIPAGRNTDGVFEQFENYSYGIRAMIKLLLNYINQQGRDTIRKILERYAPGSENPTSSYISQVSALTGFGPDQRLSPNKTTMKKLVLAMALFENRQPPKITREEDVITTQQFNEAWSKI